MCDQFCKDKANTVYIDYFLDSNLLTKSEFISVWIVCVKGVFLLFTKIDCVYLEIHLLSSFVLHTFFLQVTKLIEDATNTKNQKTAIPVQQIQDWLLENRVLSIALEGMYRIIPTYEIREYILEPARRLVGWLVCW